MQSVSPLGLFIKSIYIAGRRAIGGFSILRQSAKCTRRPNLKAARKIQMVSRNTAVIFTINSDLNDVEVTL